MHAKVVIVNKGSNRHVIKTVVEVLIYFNVKFLEAFVSESEEICHRSTLVVSSQQSHL